MTSGIETNETLNGLKGRRYQVELFLALGAYALVLAGAIAVIENGAVEGTMRTLVALAPMIPVVGVVWAVLRQFRRMDELQRRLQFEGLAFAFVGTALLSLSYGFLETVGFPRLPMFTVWPVMGALWGLGAWIASRRFR